MSPSLKVTFFNVLGSLFPQDCNLEFQYSILVPRLDLLQLKYFAPQKNIEILRTLTKYNAKVWRTRIITRKTLMSNSHVEF